ncbi:hypothetical protein DFH09DRAFT_1067439 [Mycena vulgaris]|nr:hypothetical protein DFH09DRAFT_1067439 [Mycena vulgaris]
MRSKLNGLAKPIGKVGGSNDAIIPGTICPVGAWCKRAQVKPSKPAQPFWQARRLILHLNPTVATRKTLWLKAGYLINTYVQLSVIFPSQTTGVGLVRLGRNLRKGSMSPGLGTSLTSPSSPAVVLWSHIFQHLQKKNMSKKYLGKMNRDAQDAETREIGDEPGSTTSVVAINHGDGVSMNVSEGVVEEGNANGVLKGSNGHITYPSDKSGICQGKGGKAGRIKKRRGCTHRAPAPADAALDARASQSPARILHNSQLARAHELPAHPAHHGPGAHPQRRSARRQARRHARTYPSPRPRSARKTRASQDRRHIATSPRSAPAYCAAPTTRRTAVTGRNTPASASPPGERAPHPHAASTRALKPETARNRTRPRYSACMPLMLRPLAPGARRKSVRGDGKSTCERCRKNTKKEGRRRKWDGGGTKEEGEMRWT